MRSLRSVTGQSLRIAYFWIRIILFLKIHHLIFTLFIVIFLIDLLFLEWNWVLRVIWGQISTVTKCSQYVAQIQAFDVNFPKLSLTSSFEVTEVNHMNEPTYSLFLDQNNFNLFYFFYFLKCIFVQLYYKGMIIFYAWFLTNSMLMVFFYFIV